MHTVSLPWASESVLGSQPWCLKKKKKKLGNTLNYRPIEGFNFVSKGTQVYEYFLRNSLRDSKSTYFTYFPHFAKAFIKPGIPMVHVELHISVAIDVHGILSSRIMVKKISLKRQMFMIIFF